MLKLDELITHCLPLLRINDGFDLMRCGESVRSVVVYQSLRKSVALAL